MISFRAIIKFYVSKRNDDVLHILNRMKIADPDNFANRVCELIRLGYSQKRKSSVPRMDEFHKRKIYYKTVSQAHMDGDITEDEIADMYFSANSFLDEVKKTPRLQKVIDRQLYGLTAQNAGDLNKWFNE